MSSHIQLDALAVCATNKDEHECGPSDAKGKDHPVKIAQLLLLRIAPLMCRFALLAALRNKKLCCIA